MMSVPEKPVPCSHMGFVYSLSAGQAHLLNAKRTLALNISASADVKASPYRLNRPLTYFSMSPGPQGPRQRRMEPGVASASHMCLQPRKHQRQESLKRQNHDTCGMMTAFTEVVDWRQQCRRWSYHAPQSTAGVASIGEFPTEVRGFRLLRPFNR